MEAIKRLDTSKFLLLNLLLALFLLVVCLIALVVGPTTIGITDLVTSLFSSTGDSIVHQIIFDIRLPRILFAIAVGGGLSIAGAVFQAMLMNPLAEPYILGISSGGTFGAVLSFLLGLSFLGTQVFAFPEQFWLCFLCLFWEKDLENLNPTSYCFLA